MKEKTRIVSLLLVCIMLCGMLATTAFASSGHGREYGIVNTDGTRLRAAADPYNSQNILGLLYIGEKMLIDFDPASSYGYYVTGTDGKTWARGVMQNGANIGNQGYVSVSCLDIYIV